MIKRHFAPIEKFSWAGNNPRSIVLHTMLGTLDGSLAWLEQIKLSYHYMIDIDGTVYETCPIDRCAWHAGIKDKPCPLADVFYKGVNPNRHSVGIAFARNGEQHLSKGQVVSAIGLLKDIESRTGVLYNKDNIFSHGDITSYKPPEVRYYRQQILDAMQGEQGEEDPQIILLKRLIEKLKELLNLYAKRI